MKNAALVSTENSTVFISYSRNDLSFADQLVSLLGMHSFDVLIDRHGISGGEDWEVRLGTLIRDADTVVFLLSPSSAASSRCAWEAEEAQRLGKRIIPVVHAPIENATVPAALSKLNYIYLYENSRFPGSGIGTGFAQLVAALQTDIGWLREHTRLLQRAAEWTAAPSDSRLLFGDAINAAKAWLDRRPVNAPEPTELHLAFIRASETAEANRQNDERRQLAEMAAAQDARSQALAIAEQAQKREAEQARRVARRTFLGLVTATSLAVIATGFGIYAWDQRTEATRQAEAAQASQLRSLRNSLGAQSQQAKKEATQQEMDNILWGALEFLRSPTTPGQSRDIAGFLAWLDQKESAASALGERSQTLSSVLIPLFTRALGDKDAQRRDYLALGKLTSFSSPDAVRIVNCFVDRKTRTFSERDERIAIMRDLANKARMEIEENAAKSKRGAKPQTVPSLPYAECMSDKVLAAAEEPLNPGKIKIPSIGTEKYPELSKLILKTESMDDDERQYWFDIMPSMTTEQISRLFIILDTERRKLEALELKYQAEIRSLNKKHENEWDEFAASKGDTTALLKKATSEARRKKDAASIAAVEKALTAVPVTSESIGAIFAALDDIATIEEQRIPLSAQIGARLGIVGSFDEDEQRRVAGLRETIRLRKMAIARDNKLYSQLETLQREHSVALKAKGDSLGAARHFVDHIKSLTTRMEQEPGKLRMAYAYMQRAQLHRDLLRSLDAVQHLPERAQFPVDRELIAAILADVETAMGMEKDNPSEDTHHLSAANLAAWAAATDPAFLKATGQPRIDAVVEAAIPRVDKRLFFLDTVAVYYCATGRGQKAIDVYDDIIMRLKKRSLSASDTGTPPGFQWERMARAIRGCAEGTLDPHTHAWEQYHD